MKKLVLLLVLWPLASGFANDPVMIKPTGEVFQDINFTSTHPFKFNGVAIHFSNTANSVPILDGGGLLPDSIVPNKITAGAYGDASHSLTLTLDAKGRATAVTVNPIAISESQVTSLVSDLGGKVPNSRTISTTAPLAGGGDLSANRTFSISQSNTTTDGYISSTDWNTFNNKVATSRSISTTAPLAGGGDLSANRTFSIADAAADGSTKGASTYAAADFNSASGVISIDYTNGQAASASVKGFLTAADWSTFNSKPSTSITISTTAPLAGGGDLSANRTLTIADAAADGSTKGASTYAAADFNSASGVISIDYTNGQAASGSVKGFLTAADWTAFNNKEPAIATGTSSQFWHGNKTWSVLVTNDIPGTLNATTLPLLTLSAAVNSGILWNERDATGTDWVAYATGGTWRLYNGSDRFTFGATGNFNATGTISASNFSGTSFSGNAGSATILQNARTIGGVSFNGSTNITVASATGGFAVSGGDLTVAGATSITGGATAQSFTSTGASNTVGWTDRTTSLAWNLYATSGITRLWNTTNGDVLTVGIAGDVSGKTFSATGGVFGVGLRSSSGGGLTVANSGGTDVFAVDGASGKVSANIVSATAHTIGVTGSYQPAVIFIGDSIAQLVANLTATKTVTTTSGSPTVTTSSTFTDANVGSLITGTGIPSNTYIGVLNSSASVGLSSDPLRNVPVNATASGTITSSITPYGYNNYMGAGSGDGVAAVSAIGTYNGLAVAPVVGQNVAVAGKTIEQLYEDIYPLTVKFRQESGMNIAVVGPGPGTNNLGLLNDTPAMVYSKLEAFCRFLRQNNFRVVVVGLISRGNGAGGSAPAGANAGQTWDQLVGAVNGLIRQNWTQFADRFVDWGIIGSGSNEFAAGGYSNTTYYSSDQLHPTYAGERKLAGYVQPAINDLLTYYFQTNRNQVFVNMNKASHTNVASDGMLTLRNENPSAGQSEINFSFWNGSAYVLKENIRGSYAGDLNFGATGYIADYIGSTGPDVYGTNGSDGPPLVFYRDTNKVESNRPFRITSNSGTGFATGKGLELKYDTSLDYAFVTSYDRTGSAWKPLLIEASTVKIATSGTDRIIVNTSGVESTLPARITSNSGSGFSTGKGLELNYDTSSDYGFITSYDRTAPAWKPLLIQASTIKLATNGTDRVVITTGGAAVIGSGYTGGSAGDLAVARSGGTTGVITLNSAGDRYLYYDATNYNLAGASLVVNGTTYTSDASLKQNIRDWKPADRAARKLRPRIYQRKASPKIDEIGLVAQEVQAIMPDAVEPVTIDPQNPKATVLGIKQGALLNAILAELQAIGADVDALKAASKK